MGKFPKFPSEVDRPGIAEYHKEEYKGLDTMGKNYKAAKIASDNGRCWWIESYIKANPK